MMRTSLKRLGVLTNGNLRDGNPEVVGMSHDARRIEPGNLFCALPGHHRDGHEFIAQARASGAAAALVARPVNDALPQLIVADVLQAMGVIARAWREQMPATVVGVTGSNGKTTVKEMLLAVLATQGPTLATQGNYNNEIGVPLTLVRLQREHDYAVVEMGCGQPGDIHYLADMARPEIGIVTNAGPAHLERLGSVEGVARTKGELFSALPASGLAVINADDDYSDLWLDLADHCRTMTFGLGPEAMVRGRFTGGQAEIDTPIGSFSFTPALPGRHNLCNALAATAAAVALEVPLPVIGEALAGMRSLPGRLQAHHHAEGWCLIDDTYNANPASLYAALQVLAGHGGECWLVLGDMAELGGGSAKLHAEIGQAALDWGVSRLVTVGEHSQSASTTFGRGGRHFEDIDSLVAWLHGELHAGVTCLVKGSRSMGMERVVEALMREPRTC